eukprot:5195476-Prymnesium_polylepis.1
MHGPRAATLAGATPISHWDQAGGNSAPSTTRSGHASEFMGSRVTESNIARVVGLSQSTLTRTLGHAAPNK